MSDLRHTLNPSRVTLIIQMRKIYYLSGIFVVLCFLSCKKNNTQNQNNHPVASIPVQLTIYPNDPAYLKVQVVGGWMYIDGGIRGIVLYRKSEQEFVAVERSSSHLPDNDAAKVRVMNDNFTLRDTISDSRWRMFDGQVTQGPATWALRLYGTSYNGNSLRITN